MLTCKATLKGKSLKGDRKLFTFLASSYTEDRDAERVNQNGWMLDLYRGNPVVLDSHNYGSIDAIIGRTVSLRISPEGLESDIEFADTERGRLAQHLVETGFLNAVSVGFRSLERSGSRLGKEKLEHVKSELLEISMVCVPANPEALRRRAAELAEDVAEVAKAGRVLSRANEARLRAVEELLDEAHIELRSVLSQVSAQLPIEPEGIAPEGQPDKSASPDSPLFTADLGAFRAFVGTPAQE